VSAKEITIVVDSYQRKEGKFLTAWQSSARDGEAVEMSSERSTLNEFAKKCDIYAYYRFQQALTGMAGEAYFNLTSEALRTLEVIP
jgi:hypothetical protein